VAGSERVSLRSAFEHLHRLDSLVGEVPAPAIATLFSNICASVAQSKLEEQVCVDLVGDFMKNWSGLRGIAGRLKMFMGMFELKGRCLVKRGVEVEDPSACEGSLDGGLLIVGSRMQVFIDRELRSAVYRVDGSCAVAIGEIPSLYGIETLSKAKKPGVVACYEGLAHVAVGPCSFSDLPKLAEKAINLAEGKYSEIYKRCYQKWRDASGEEVSSLLRELAFKRHIDLLEELEEGERS
jgi:hypothetical protein